jgi:diaminopimelate decarboxylase
MISSFSYQKNILGANTAQGWIPLDSVLNPGKVSYVYNTHSIQQRIQKLKSAFSSASPQMHYAMKANSHPQVLKLMVQNQMGADVVSAGEARLALEAGFSAAKIIFSGVGKSKEELTFAIQNSFFQINVESLEELNRVGQLAQSLQKKTAVGIRINPNIRVDTHPYITTGFRENKFGISEYQLSEAQQIIRRFSPWLELQGLSSHIGSQIRDITPLVESLESLIQSSRALIDQGFPIKTLDMGGGVGIDYFSDDETKELQFAEDLGKKVSSLMKASPTQLLMEPGRWLVARAGVLCAQIEYVKFNGYKNFVILNTGMHHLLRPALYKAHHRILPLHLRKTEPAKIYDVVGPICESSDVLGQDRSFSSPQEGDWFAIMDAGAYGMVMSSHYNHHPLPTEVLI